MSDPSTPPAFCCPMRQKYVLTIVGDVVDAPDPPNLVDFLDFDLAHPNGKPIIRIAFCPFCAKPQGRGPVRIVGVDHE